MALPTFVIRSYAGGAEQAQLLEQMGSTDLTFGITTTVGWTESSGPNIGQPLGTSGPFVVIIDRFSNTTEKILCSGVNLSTGIVTVWTSGGSGRGYDGTSPQEHVPGTPGGVQTTWPAAEAYEANQAANALFGGTPSTGQVLQWNGTRPIYGTGSGVSGNPAARMFGNGGTQTIPAGTDTLVGGLASDFSRGGLAFAAGNTLIAPITGWYRVSANAAWSNNNNATYITRIHVQGVFTGTQSVFTGTPNTVTGTIVSTTDIVHVLLNQFIQIGVLQSAGGPLPMNLSNDTSLAAELVSS